MHNAVRVDTKTEIHQLRQASTDIALAAAIWANSPKDLLGLKEVLILSSNSGITFFGPKRKIWEESRRAGLAMLLEMPPDISGQLYATTLELEGKLASSRIVPRTKVRMLALALANNPVATSKNISIACNVSVDTARVWLRKAESRDLATRSILGNTDFFFCHDLMLLIERLSARAVHFQKAEPVSELARGPKLPTASRLNPGFFKSQRG
jgi:hypothetical protein